MGFVKYTVHSLYLICTSGLRQREDIQEEIETEHCSEGGVLRDFCDGSFVRNLVTGEPTLF